MYFKTRMICVVCSGLARRQSLQDSHEVRSSYPQWIMKGYDMPAHR